jgi:hypothetical protein
MFRLEIFVHKKHLADVFERLTGIAEVHSCAVVPNLDAKPNGRIYQTAATTIELLTNELHRRKLTQVTGSEFKAMVTDLKLNPVSYSHYVHSLLQAGVLKKHKKVKNAMQYIVTGK